MWRELHAHRGRLTAVARNVGVPPHDAEDVVSDTLLRAAGYGDLDRARLPQVLSTVLHRCLADRALGVAREAEALMRGWQPRQQPPDPVEQEVVGRDYVESILAEACLTAREESVFHLVARGHAQPDIAGRLGVSVKAAQRSLERARSKLRRVLAEDPARYPKTRAIRARVAARRVVARRCLSASTAAR
jgi:DNA-directed RNA polymerase specialized sigma24 family protein